MKTAIACIAMAPLAGCATLHGNYKLTVVDANGRDLAPGLSIMAEGAGIYSVRNAMCSTHPGATVLIKDARTGEQLKSESPHQCRETVAVPKAALALALPGAPQQLSMDGNIYTLAWQQTRGSLSTYQYTTAGDSVERWKSLLTLQYETSASHNEPISWGKEFNQTMLKSTSHVRAWAKDGHGYGQLVFAPDAKYSQYEVAGVKSFHLVACNTLVTLQYAKHMQANEGEQSNPALQHENIKAMAALSGSLVDALLDDTWAPTCARRAPANE
jgi:hypothetical protein